MSRKNFNLDLSNLPLKELNAVLLLETGDYFIGKGIGKLGISAGELCFNTATTGYQETISDPSYVGQIIVFTFPHIGNVGINNIDQESVYCGLKGIILRNHPTPPSNYRSQQNLIDFMQEKNIIGICEVDTRLITQAIRNIQGALKCIIGSWTEITNYQSKIDLLRYELQKETGISGKNLTQSVSTKTPYRWPISLLNESHQSGHPHIIILDFGVKHAILDMLYNNNCSITILPGESNFSEILSFKPDGILISNGPGDPREVFKRLRSNIQSLIDSDIPILGICLGHQLLALALGGEIQKMACGHHGINHPVQDMTTLKVLISSHNHEFTVVPNDIFNAKTHITYRSLFDGTVEGFSHKNKFIRSIQFHPEASPGPHEAHAIFKEFVNIIRLNQSICSTSSNG